MFEEGCVFSDNKDVSEESVITEEDRPELKTHLQPQTMTPLSRQCGGSTILKSKSPGWF